MKKSFKNIEIGYSTEITSSLMEALKNNDEYLYSSYKDIESSGLIGCVQKPTPSNVTWAYNGGNPDLRSEVIISTPFYDVKPGHHYRVGANFRTFYTESTGATGFSAINFDLSIYRYDGSTIDWTISYHNFQEGGDYTYNGTQMMFVFGVDENPSYDKVKIEFVMSPVAATGGARYSAWCGGEYGSPISVHIFDLGKNLNDVY